MYIGSALYGGTQNPQIPRPSTPAVMDSIRFYPTNTTIPLTFYVTAAGGQTYLNLSTTARCYDNNTGQNLGLQTIVFSYSNPVGLWTVAGNGQVLKRMTTMAQQGDNFKTCSHLEYVYWTDCQIGVSGNAATVKSWTTANWNKYNYPDDYSPKRYYANGLPIVRINGINSIDSQPPDPSNEEVFVALP